MDERYVPWDCSCLPSGAKPVGHHPQAIWDVCAVRVASTPSRSEAVTLSRLRLREHNRGREVTRLSERGAVWSARAVWAVAAVLVVANAVLIVVAFPDLHPGDRFYNSLGDVGGLL